MAIKRIPAAVGLLVCDQVIFAEKTRNPTLVNCFSFRRVAKFPSLPVPFTVFSLLSGGAGDILLEVVINRLDTLDEVWRRGYKGHFQQTMAATVFTLPVRGCSFPAEGYYEATLFADHELIAARKFAVRSKEIMP
ncbi:MAG TPA: hypothetical protein VE988_29325 [Gemmataceae bacterium]|nr:hypothetical protein [Gemmataceae bacterium]